MHHRLLCPTEMKSILFFVLLNEMILFGSLFGTASEFQSAPKARIFFDPGLRVKKDKIRLD